MNQINALHYGLKQKQTLTVIKSGTGRQMAGETRTTLDIFSKSDEELQKELFESDFMQRYLKRKQEG